ncbi:MAG: hypothetical protein ABI560_17975 [Myxococcales bacterium]
MSNQPKGKAAENDERHQQAPATTSLVELALLFWRLGATAFDGLRD